MHQVFPHIIADYTSKKLKLDSPATFRDLSKPIGMQLKKFFFVVAMEHVCSNSELKKLNFSCREYFRFYMYS